MVGPGEEGGLTSIDILASCCGQSRRGMVGRRSGRLVQPGHMLLLSLWLLFISFPSPLLLVIRMAVADVAILLLVASIVVID